MCLFGQLSNSILLNVLESKAKNKSKVFVNLCEWEHSVVQAQTPPFLCRIYATVAMKRFKISIISASVSHVSASPTPQVSTSTVHSTTHPTPHGTQCGHDMCYHGKCSWIKHCPNNVCEQYYHQECSCYSDYEGDSCSLKRGKTA